MATAWGLRWGLSRTGTLLLAPPARCARRALHRQVDGTTFQSIYSLDKLYPESKGADTAWKVPEHAKQASSYIPLDRLSISYCRSSGPGGQNVNKGTGWHLFRFKELSNYSASTFLWNKGVFLLSPHTSSL
ncbi:immature colon carcinoma transcript 1, isoform CRA_b [Mus musculus]|nr:immature colon carcinoma transcript 1, isoform CRA_b [Mus musculus]